MGKDAIKNIYVSLDEAREEIKKRWNDQELKGRVETELGEKFMSVFKDKPRGVSFRQVCPPDNGFVFFYQYTRYIGAEPLIVEYHNDIFTHINEEKKGLGRLRVTLPEGEAAMVDIMDFHANEKKKLNECTLKGGENLIDFYRNLFSLSDYKADFIENSSWFHGIGRASEYYYYFLLHFVAHGFLSENLSEGDEKQKGFSDEIMLPAIEKIKDKFGFYPMIVRSYPDNQNNIEDFYWWCCPKRVNDYIVNYAVEKKLDFKRVNLK